ncbi:hypothetical protein [Haloglomus salinum]|uniref:hypothetical protein n=1 Tax=Haloglomus salinum TaxID=2962673 RepID=UPI0020C9799C|nr:hypothetical protein [Haloglomus salinum]
MSVLTLMAPFRGRSSTRGTEDSDSRPGPCPLRLLPGFVPGGWKRNVVVGLTYLLGVLVLLGVVRFVIELF